LATSNQTVTKLCSGSDRSIGTYNATDYIRPTTEHAPQCYDCDAVGWAAGGVLAQLSVWSEVQTCHASNRQPGGSAGSSIMSEVVNEERMM